jgi:hypothetical protein
MDDEWVIRWGFYYESDREGDFIILGPIGGVLVLEVKGGDLRKLSTIGRWEGPARDHPVAQLLAEWSAVIDTLRESASAGVVPFVAKALCLPDLDIDPKLAFYKEIDRSLIVDRDDLASFETTWRRLFTSYDRTTSKGERRAFLDSFAKEISPKAIRYFISETDRIILRQTTAEYHILDLVRGNRQIVVEGGPGSGKTWLALEQAFRFADDGLQVLFLCYNVALADQLSLLVAKRKAQKGEVIVRSWETLSRELLDAAGVGWDNPVTPAEREVYFGEVIPNLMRDIARDQVLKPRFDALVVDEAQDHDSCWPGSESDNTNAGWWEIYWKLLREKTNARMAIFYDRAQRPLFRQRDRFHATRLFERLSQPAQVSLQFRRSCDGRKCRHPVPGKSARSGGAIPRCDGLPGSRPRIALARQPWVVCGGAGLRSCARPHQAVLRPVKLPVWPREGNEIAQNTRTAKPLPLSPYMIRDPVHKAHLGSC